MTLLTTLALFGFSTEAFAGSPYYAPIDFSKTFSSWNMKKNMGAVGKVKIDGTVDIPLYASTLGKPELLTYVGTDVEDDGELFLISPSSSAIVVTEGFAKERDLDIKVDNKRLIPVPEDFKAGGEIKYVTIPELHVGGLVLKKVTAFVSSSEIKGFDSTGGLNFKKASIGLGALDDSYAILESEGVLRVTKKKDGPELIKSLAGTSVPYQEIDWSIGTVGSWSLTGKSKTIFPALSLIVPASFGSPTEVQTLLSFHTAGSTLDSYYPIEGASPVQVNDLRYDWMTPTLAGQKLDASYVSRPAMVDVTNGPIPMAMIGATVLSNYDIVVDKSSQTIAFAPRTGQKRLSSLEEELQRAKDDLSKKDETEKKSKDKEEEEEELNIGGLKTLISLLKKDNQLKATLEHYDALVNDDGEKTDCQLWLDYGHVQRNIGNINASLSAYQEASRLYHSWWDIDLHTRMDINNAQGEMKEGEIESAKERSKEKAINTVENGWYITQPDSCYIADGYTGYTQMLLGKYDQVESLYREQLDLDGNLARALGNTALLSNNTELAHEAYRQAIQMENGRGERRINRIGLALIYADQGKWEQANNLFMEAMDLEFRSANDLLTPQIWLDHLRHFDGNDAALTAIDKWVASHPTDLDSHIARLREYTLQMNSQSSGLIQEEQPNTEDSIEELDSEGSETIADKNTPLPSEKLTEGFAKATAEAKTAFAKFEESSNGNGLALSRTNHYALYIQYLAYSGDLDKAEEVLNSLGERYHPQLSIAAANVYALQGRSEEALSALQTAARHNPSHPGYALLLKP
jgi:tetratricopeptide (TPR) repeat protein